MTQKKRVRRKKQSRGGEPLSRTSAADASLLHNADEPLRCQWASNPLAIRYHDREWGAPQHNDRVLFEFLILEGAQAGLSWDTILRKRENYRAAFNGFDPAKVARYNDKKVRALLGNEGIIRNRLKIASAIQNAHAYLVVQKEFGSFDRYIWQFVGGKPRVNAWRLGGKLPARTEESDAMSKDLKKRRFNFVGSTICYAFMQAMGMVNDHAVECFRYGQLLAIDS
ncbi:MAG: DNA-3-methyladenine glycosylase I [Terriglobales bacterium]|jgi:DNA-3-methyladenine glycosylase I